MCKNQDKEVVMLQEMHGYAIDQAADEMEAAEEEWKQSGSPVEPEEQMKESFNRMMEKNKNSESR